MPARVSTSTTTALCCRQLARENPHGFIEVPDHRGHNELAHDVNPTAVVYSSQYFTVGCPVARYEHMVHRVT